MMSTQQDSTDDSPALLENSKKLLLQEIKEQITETLNAYVQFLSEEDLLKLPLDQVYKDIIGDVSTVFQPLIEYKNKIINEKRKECKKQYKKMLLEQIPDYQLQKCSVCCQSELSTHIITLECKHLLCSNCIVKLEYLVEDFHPRDMEIFNVAY